MRKTWLLLTTLILFTGWEAQGQFYTGTIEDQTFYSKALDRETTVRVYLPPGYQSDSSAEQYPVIYTLHGASVDYEIYNYMFPIIDYLWLSGDIEHFILVMPNGQCEPFNGSFYTNSSLYGNYEDLIAEEIVPLIDSLYNTRPTRNFRAIMGHSMGSYGAFKQVLKHPDLYSAVAGHSGPLHVGKMDILLDDVKKENGSPPYNWQYTPGKMLTNLIFTLAGAFSPDPASDILVEFPLNEQAEIIDSVMQKWEKHNIAALVSQHLPPADLAIYFDCGSQDELKLFVHNRAFSDTLRQYGIRHQYVEYLGDHSSGLPFRVPVALRFIDQVFRTSQAEEILAPNKETDVINVFPNPGTGQFWYSSDNATNLQRIRITDLSGKELDRFQPEVQPLNLSHYPGGLYFIFFEFREKTIAKKILLSR